MSDALTVPETFRLISQDDLQEYRGVGYLFEHIPTGCRIYHVHNDDHENMFSFGFRTPPKDSSGVAHILEHSVLCGSRNFPVKDPFLSMMKGSVNTFLNAMTYPDKTLYPSASVLKKDYFHLMHVYGDAVFFPLLKKEVFRQEGHRLERDEKGTLRRVGIVYNEMKGNYSSQEGIASEWAVRTLFPDTPYSVDSGGDPEVIPQLTYEEFLEYHRTWYHPSNCKIFLYGDVSPRENLEFLEKNFLSSFERREADTAVPLQSPWTAPAEREVTWPSGEEEGTEGKTTLLLSWKTLGPEDPVRTLSLSILTEMLLGNSGAPLQKALQQSGLGEDVSPVSGIDTDLNEAVFTVGLRGSDPDRKEAFRELVFSVLGGLAEEGFPEDLKESCLRLVEFRAREIKGGGPFGLRLLRKAMKGWNYDLPPGRTIRFDPVMKEVRERAAQPGYFESLLKDLILENPHYALVTVKPDPESRRRQEDALRQELDRINAALTDREKEELDQENQALRVFQEEADDPESRRTIPSLHREDIPREIQTIPCEEAEEAGIPVYRQKVFTNGILYTEMAFDLSGLEEEYLSYLPLFCKSLSGTGLPGIPYDAVTREIAMKTGGFGASLEASRSLSSSPGEPPRRSLFVRLKMLESLSRDALELAGKLLLQADFDNTERLGQLLTELKNDMQASLMPAGHSYVSLRANSRLSRASSLEDRWFGISQLGFLKELAEREGEEDLKRLAAVLKRIRKAVIVRSGLLLSLTMDESVMDRHSREVTDFWKETLPERPEDPGSLEAALPRGEEVFSEDPLPAEGLAISGLVGFVGASLRGTPLGSPEHSAQILLSHMLKTGPLWEKIRMKGGAYGASSSLSGLEETFTFATYRDPHIEESLDAFRSSLEEYARFEDGEELEKSLISVVGRDLRPLSPSEKSMISFKRRLYGIADEIRQRKRDQLMEMTPGEIRDAARTLLEQWGKAIVEVMAHPDHLDRASSRWPGLKDRRVDLQ